MVFCDFLRFISNDPHVFLLRALQALNLVNPLIGFSQFFLRASKTFHDFLTDFMRSLISPKKYWCLFMMNILCAELAKRGSWRVGWLALKNVVAIKSGFSDFPSAIALHIKMKLFLSFLRHQSQLPTGELKAQRPSSEKAQRQFQCKDFPRIPFLIKKKIGCSLCAFKLVCFMGTNQSTESTIGFSRKSSTILAF